MLTWNIEGLRRNIFNLIHLKELFHPDIIFLTETQLFDCDVQTVMSHMSGDYCYFLNSSDKYEPELALQNSKAYGGTMILWKRELHPFITVRPAQTSAFLPLVFKPPGAIPSIHVCVYLPTCGRDRAFHDDLSKLSEAIDILQAELPESPTYLRGDFNVNDKNQLRKGLLASFMLTEGMIEVPQQHPTYHHFTRNGTRDSHLDKVLHSKTGVESILQILCKYENTFIDSHHDAILSQCFIKKCLPQQNITCSNISVPKQTNTRHRILWTDDGIEQYQSLLIPNLERLQELWLSGSSKSCTSLFIEATNNVLVSCAAATNKWFSLGAASAPKSKCVPPQIRKSSRNLSRKWRRLKEARKFHKNNPAKTNTAYMEYRQAKLSHRKTLRDYQTNLSIKRDESLLKDPKPTFSKIRRAKNPNAARLAL